MRVRGEPDWLPREKSPGEHGVHALDPGWGVDRVQRFRVYRGTSLTRNASS